MPAESFPSRAEILEALAALDTPAMQRVAELAAVSERTLWRWRKGETQPTPAIAKPVARALGLVR